VRAPRVKARVSGRDKIRELVLFSRSRRKIGDGGLIASHERRELVQLEPELE